MLRRTLSHGEIAITETGYTLLRSSQMATLAVHEAMGAKVDREAIATLVLPQLWAMVHAHNSSRSIIPPAVTGSYSGAGNEKGASPALLRRKYHTRGYHTPGS